MTRKSPGRYINRESSFQAFYFVTSQLFGAGRTAISILPQPVLFLPLLARSSGRTVPHNLAGLKSVGGGGVGRASSASAPLWFSGLPHLQRVTSPLEFRGHPDAPNQERTCE